MTWFNTLKLAASPKNIINNWKVDDPFLKFFIYTYEPIIDLSKIKNQDDLKTFIQNSLIPSLQGKIDINNPKGYYKKTLTDEEALGELNEHQHDHRVQQARRIFENDREGAKKEILKAINEDKKKSFDKWWGYMSEGYSDNPAFLYSVLNPMIESSPATQKDGPPPAHREVISLINEEIGKKGVTQMNVFKKFTKTSFELDKNTSEFIDIDKDKSWIRIDSKLRDSGKYKSNQEKLMRFSTGSGWCIAGESLCNTYLSKGDFWLYFENKRPKTAIRLHGDKDVQEIRGLYNKEKTLDPFWEQITTFLHNSNFDYQSNTAYKRLKGIMDKNINLSELEETDPEKFQKIYQSILNSIKEDPKQLGTISDENKARYPELVRTAAVGYENRMNILLDAVENISPTGNEYQLRFSKFQDEFSDIPNEVKPHLSGDIEGRLLTVHKKAFLRNPLEFEYFPDDIKASFTDIEKRIAWTHYVGNDPYRYNDLRVPEEVRKLIPIENIVKGWDELVNLNINHIDNIPSRMLKIHFPPNYAKDKIIEDFKRYPCNLDKKGFDKLRRIQENNLMSEEEIASVYLDTVNRNPNIFRYIPSQYRDFVKGNVQDISPIAQKNLDEVISDASYFNAISDPEIKNYLLKNKTNELIQAFLKLQQKYGNDLHGYWSAIPLELQPYMPDYLKENVANFYLPYVQQNRDFLNNISPVSISKSSPLILGLIVVPFRFQYSIPTIVQSVPFQTISSKA